MASLWKVPLFQL